MELVELVGWDGGHGSGSIRCQSIMTDGIICNNFQFTTELMFTHINKVSPHIYTSVRPFVCLSFNSYRHVSSFVSLLLLLLLLCLFGDDGDADANSCPGAGCLASLLPV